MKYFISTLILVGVLCGLGYLIYSVVLEQDSDVVSSELEGLEAIRPRNMKITENSGESFVVAWDVASSVTGYIKYGDTSATLSLIAQDVTGTAALKRHKVRVNNLTPGKKYYFWVMSDDIAFGRDGRALEVLMIEAAN